LKRVARAGIAGVASARAFLLFSINWKRVARSGKSAQLPRALSESSPVNLKRVARAGKARVTPVRAFLVLSLKPETRLNSIKGRCGSCARFHGVFLLT
jgi:hypothetical protein